MRILKIEVESAKKGEPNKTIDLEVNQDIKLGQIRRITAEWIKCNPSELLIKNKAGYLGEVLMYDRLSQYISTHVITFWFWT